MTELLIKSNSSINARELLESLIYSQDKDIFIDPKIGNKVESIEIIVTEDTLEINQADFEDVKNNNPLGFFKMIIDSSKLYDENSNLKQKVRELEELPIRNPAINKKLTKKILKLRGKGMSFQAIADDLHERGLFNSEGRRINPKLVSRLYQKAKNDTLNPMRSKTIYVGADEQK